METRSIKLHHAMIRQLTTLFEKMGNFRGGKDVMRVTTMITMRRRRRRMTMLVRSWEEKEGKKECKNQICRRRHHRDKGGPYKGHGLKVLHCIDGHWGGDEVFGKGGA